MLSDQEYAGLLQLAHTQLNVKQKSLAQLIQQWPRYWYDLDRCTLEFKDSQDRVRANASQTT